MWLPCQPSAGVSIMLADHTLLARTTCTGPSQSPVIVANDDSYTIRATAGLTSSRLLNVLQNDTGSGILTLLDVQPLPAGSSSKGRVKISADKQAIEYAVDFDGRPFVEAFRYQVRDATGAISSARVEVVVGKYCAAAVWDWFLHMMRPCGAAVYSSACTCLAAAVHLYLSCCWCACN
jgi:hypothetical protein